MGGGDRQEQLALGEVPNIAARLQGLAAPDTVVLSAATYRLVQGFVACDDLGAQTLKGTVAPMRLYRVLGESGAQSRLDAAVRRGLTPLVGREAEITLLLERWAQAKTVRARWWCSAVRRVLANRAWCRSCRRAWSKRVPRAWSSTVRRITSRAPCTRPSSTCSGCCSFTGKTPRGEARQAGAGAAGVWLASARDDAVVCCPAVATSARSTTRPCT